MILTPKQDQAVRLCPQDSIWRQTSSKFKEITQHLLIYIQQTYIHGGDIQKELDDKTEFDFNEIMPKRSRSTNEDEDLKVQEDEDY